MAEQHGKSATVLANEFDVSAYNNALSFSGSRAVSDVSPFGVDDKTYIAGQADGTFNLAGNWNDDAAADLELATNLGQTVVYSACPAGAATLGNTAFLWQPDVQDSYVINMPVNDAIRVNHGGACVSRFAGRLLHTLSAASVGNGTSVDDTAQTTDGGVGHLHVTAFTGTNITVTIEDSANDSTWATLQAFTTATGVGSERIEPAGTVERYLRVVVAGTFSAATIAVTFARNRY